MNWQKLNKDSLEGLKAIKNYILVGNPNDKEFPYDLILFFKEDIQDGIPSFWYSMLHHACYKCGEVYEYDDEDVINCYTHFCVVNEPLG